MSENALGFHHNLGLGNMSSGVGERLNQQIRSSNLSNLTKYQTNVKNAVDTYNLNSLQDNAYKKLGEVVGDQLLTKGKAVDDTIKAVQKTYGALRDAKKMGFTKLEGPAESFTSEATRMTRRAAFLDEDAPAKAGLSGLEVLGGALQVGLAADDIYNDAKGGFSKLNDASKVGNIGEIAAGGAELGAAVVAGSEAVGLTAALEGAGFALDASGLGAPVGVALNILGGITGLAAAGADLIGDKEQSDTDAANKQTAINQTVKQQAQVPIVGKALGTTGAEVKNNIQEGR